ncbi:MAG: endonuclease/exonuclease/phosphatase family protein [Acetobacteraceae bacterium]
MSRRARLPPLLRLAAAAHAATAASAAATAQQPREIRLATWNISWLTTRPAGHPDLPAGMPVRSPEDLRLLRHYASRLDADIVALQEVDGPLAAARVFDARAYDFHFTRERDVQRVGFAIRRTFPWRANPDLADLDLVPNARLSLRRGADITVETSAGRLRLLAVHLRGGCLRDDLEDPDRPACVQLARQARILADWISARAGEGTAFAVLGDFNRRLDGEDAMWRTLSRAAPLVRVADGGPKPCWGLNRPFIDHLVFGGESRAWVVPGSLQVLTYRTRDFDGWRDRLSDHCPLSVRLDPARRATDGSAGRASDEPAAARRWLWLLPAEPGRAGR